MAPGRHIIERIGYHLEEKIAEGGMGVVYRAQQSGVGAFRKRVAIKLIKECYSSLPQFQANFIGEACLVSNLIHPNIVQTYHLGSVARHYYIVMEYVHGINLEDFIAMHLARGLRVPLDVAAFIISRVVRALAYAHARCDESGRPLEIVHRDVTPRNILLSGEGDVKLTDFGIAKASLYMYSHEGEIVAGKDGYLSPEQVRKERSDRRSDLFSCGVLLAELLMGVNLFDQEDELESRRRICEMPLPAFPLLRTDLDPRLCGILNCALQRSRDARYQSAGEMLNALELYLYSGGYGPTNEKFAAYLADLGVVASAAGGPPSGPNPALAESY